jgi:hypothetical protein
MRLHSLTDDLTVATEGQRSASGAAACGTPSRPSTLVDSRTWSSLVLASWRDSPTFRKPGMSYRDFLRGHSPVEEGRSPLPTRETAQHRPLADSVARRLGLTQMRPSASASELPPRSSAALPADAPPRPASETDFVAPSPMTVRAPQARESVAPGSLPPVSRPRATDSSPSPSPSGFTPFTPALQRRRTSSRLEANQTTSDMMKRADTLEQSAVKQIQDSVARQVIGSLRSP